MCINTLEGGKGFISSAVTCIIRQQHYPHGEAACRAVSIWPCKSLGSENVEMNSNSLSFFCLSDVRVCMCVWVRRNRTHTFEQLENLLLLFFCLCGWKYFGISRVFPLLFFFCRSFYDDEVGETKGSFKSKMRLLVTCVTQGRDCLSLSGSLCFALFFPPPFLPNSFHLLRVFQSPIPNPILPGPSFPCLLFFVLFHTTRIDIVRVCRCATERSRHTHTKAEPKETFHHATWQYSFVWFRIFSFCYF